MSKLEETLGEKLGEDLGENLAPGGYAAGDAGASAFTTDVIAYSVVQSFCLAHPTTTYRTIGTGVSSWKDQKNAHDLDNATAAEQPAESTTADGRGLFVFDGSDDSLAADVIAGAANRYGFFLVASFDDLTTAANQTIANLRSAGDTAVEAFFQIFASTDQWRGWIQENYTSDIDNDTGLHFIAFDAGAADARFTIDGTTYTATASTLDALSTFRVGSATTAGGFADCNLALAGLFNAEAGAATVAEIRQLCRNYYSELP